MKRVLRARRSRVVAGVVAVTLTAAGLGTWATDTWPFDAKDRYCWGAWEEDSGPEFLGDEAFTDGKGSRTAEETALGPRRTTGRCTVAIHAPGYVGDDPDDSMDTRVIVDYGPAPRSAARRMEWINDYLGGRAVPLPDGLPGATDGNHGLLVLPERCDTRDGRPTAITLDATATSSEDGHVYPGTVRLGGSRSVAALMVSVANRAMAKTGCAPAKPLRTTSPVLTLPEERETFFTRACRIRGLEFDRKTAMDLAYQVGTVGRDLQSCSVRTNDRGEGRVFDALMVSAPRLAALFDGTTGSKAAARGWRGTGVFADGYKVVRADCAGRPMILLMLAPSLHETTPYFTAFTDAVTERVGCAPVAPGGSDR
ncbi:hypothetical protein HUT19_29440 [Streptomyces sp. NA02950]|uniref:hypothetical protein n=1 Tax=Streptomyces sp. NA02950 TaxID=2742137 RepID=UPI0015904EBB|nr:hypothetical protein [Streptomyces sp. NA02950]QKV95343.1 hypothetical protein HUT19_29440 [Streptomyces sp. NA02950]